MRFEEAYGGWGSGRLSQEEAARLLGVCSRTFRRYVWRYEEEGLEGLKDRRMDRPSARRAPLDEVMALTCQYQSRHLGWSVRHFHSWYKRAGGERSYGWVKNRLQEGGLVKKSPGRGKHRKKRDRSAWPGMMLHQDGSTHQWVPGQYWDLVVTMDDATNEHYSMLFVVEEGTASSFAGMKEVIASRGLFSSLYTDRGSHYWNTPEAGGKVDREHLTQFGRAMKQLGIVMIPAYSPEARGRSERMFSTHQSRLPKELALAGITEIEEANRYLREKYMPAFNTEFKQPAMEEGSAFVSYVGGDLNEVLCEHYERRVGKDNCVSFDALKLQIPADGFRIHYVKAYVRVHRYLDGRMGLFHGPRLLARYEADARLIEQKLTKTNQKERSKSKKTRAASSLSYARGRSDKLDNSFVLTADSSIC